MTIREHLSAFRADCDQYPKTLGLLAGVIIAAIHLLLSSIFSVVCAQPPPLDRGAIERQLIQARAQRDMLAERRVQLDEQIMLLSGRLQQAEQVQREADAKATAQVAPTPTPTK